MRTRLMRVSVCILALAAGCGDKQKAAALPADGGGGAGGGGAAMPDAGGGGMGPPTVDDVLAGRVASGTVLTLRATVGAVTYLRTTPAPSDPEQLGELTGDRVVLLQPAAAGPPVFGVGAVLTGDVLRARTVRLPARGDVVEVTGTLATLRYNDEDQPILRPVTALRVVTPVGPALADVGAACALDADCQDDLWCDRASGKCLVPAETLTWHSALRNINGTCQADADCPTRQACQLDYTIVASGPYSPHYGASRDVGRHLCRVDPAAAPEVHCGRPVAPEDVLSGRYPEGKEVCVRARVEFPVVASDRDTHVQLLIDGAKVFPLSSPLLDIFHFAAEITPIHKDPANPLGPMLDPPAGAMIEALGTVHYDDGHGWWEIHPIKWYRVLGQARGAGAAPGAWPQARRAR